MKQVTLNIPENKYDFFMELIESLGLELEDDLQIPEEHKKLVLDRIKKSNSDNFIPWDEARKILVGR
ncbi:MAG: hypothetical protein ABJP45_03560 [Cyclobacteriaceae bacterium]